MPSAVQSAVTVVPSQVGMLFFTVVELALAGCTALRSDDDWGDWLLALPIIPNRITPDDTIPATTRFLIWCLLYKDTSCGAITNFKYSRELQPQEMVYYV